MALEVDIKKQLEQYLDLMEGEVVIKVSVDDSEVSNNMLALINEVADMSPFIKVENSMLDRTPSFSINRTGEDTGVVFSGVPLGHEFSSFVLALLQVSGRPPKIEEQTLIRIKNLKGSYKFETYINLSCHNCPEVVQSLNMLSIYNSNITHTMIDGSVFKEEVEKKDIMAVPTVYLNGSFFISGRVTLERILDELGESQDNTTFENLEPYDVLVVGGGPAGASAAVYAARKGIRTGLIAERFGGQILDTLTIENFISVPYTEGAKLASSLEEHVKQYPIDVFQSKRAKSIQKADYIELILENDQVIKSKTVILATGAKWRQLGVPGEKEYKNKGVAYCPHCDGPIFEGKHVAVIGGGNSGIEAAIDLAGIAKHVTVCEFLPELKADQVLQERLRSLENVTVLTNVQTKEITGDQKVNGITYIDRDTNEEKHVELQGVFVQIGLVPNTEWLNGIVERNRIGEIIVDERGATNVLGVYAAGDCTNSAYKQIIIAMGSGATAALGAFDYMIRH